VTHTVKARENTVERRVRTGLGVWCGGRRSDQAPSLPNLTFSITCSYNAGKAMNQSDFLNEISKENYKTNQVNSYLNMMLKMTYRY
jgi:hypothetical protein